MTEVTTFGLTLPDRDAPLDETLLGIADNWRKIDSALLRYGSSYDLLFQTLAFGKEYQSMFYDGFVVTGTYARTASIGYDPQEGSYESLAAAQTVTFPIVANFGVRLTKFNFNTDTRGQAGLIYHYNTGDGTWVLATLGENTVAGGFDTLIIRATFPTAGLKLFSLSVLYNPKISYNYGQSGLFEVADYASTQAISTILTIPNAASYVPNGKTLTVQLLTSAGAVSRYLVPGRDYDEASNTSIRLLKALTGTFSLVFRAELNTVNVDATAFVWTKDLGASDVLTATTLRVAGDKRPLAEIGRSIRVLQGAVTNLSHITAAAYDGGSDTTTLTLDSNMTITGTPSSVYYGLSTQVAPYPPSSAITTALASGFTTLFNAAFPAAFDTRLGSAFVATNVTFAPAGNLAATNVGAALVELDTEKFAASGGAISGSTTITGDLTVSGDISGLSDRRLKSEVLIIEQAMDKIKALRGVTYTMNDRRGAGVIAQEVQAVLPEVVHESRDTGMLSVAYGNIVGLLIEGMKELDDRLRSLELNNVSLK